MNLSPQHEPLYIFAVWMLGSRESALEHVRATLEQDQQDVSAQLRTLISTLIAAEKPARTDHFAELDDKLRSNFTIPVDLDHPLVKGEVRRLHVLLSELQRSCLLTTLRGLAPLRRAAFILRHVLGLPLERCVELCGSTADAFLIAEGRSRRALEDYLGARCQHLDPKNPCHCAARLGNALECGLVGWPEHGEHTGDPFIPAPQRGVAVLYAALPRVRLPVATTPER